MVSLTKNEETFTGISSLRVTTFVSVYVAVAMKLDLLSERPFLLVS
jgi:hypothetical protein